MASSPVIYIIDDDASVRAALARLVQSAGFDPKTFNGASHFLETAAKDHPVCILLDIDMPLASELELQVRLETNGTELPVITLSARDEDKTRSLARSLGAQFLLRKPVDGQALLDAIAWVSGTKCAR
jgi:FixJ family two-component response regulator